MENLVSNKPELKRFLGEVGNVWPEHMSFIEKSLSARTDDQLSDSEDLAGSIMSISEENISEFCSDYRWTCDELNKEEFEFRRTGKYKFSKLEEVIDQIYNNDFYMTKYMRGMLLSQVLWENHSKTISFFKRSYLSEVSGGESHLEVGPGHGLLLHLAKEHGEFNKLYGWDISESSLRETSLCLEKLGHSKEDYTLEKRNVMESINEDVKFDSITISEVLEHTENPIEILKSLKILLKENGKIFINIPINCPAPDHIYLLETPDEVTKLVESSGLKVLKQENFPMTGFSIERAMKLKATVSCVIIAGL